MAASSIHFLYSPSYVTDSKSDSSKDTDES